MKAYKCDRCGKLFEKYEFQGTISFYNISTNPNMTGCCLDLCKNCNDELQEWVDAFTKIKAESEDTWKLTR